MQIHFMNPEQILIQTDRLSLRPITQDDADDLMDLFSDPVAMAYFPNIKSRQETMVWIDSVLNRYQTDGYGFYACILKDSGLFIGYSGPLLQRNVDGRDEIEIGYGLIRKYWHHGYATEAAKACMDYAFDHLGAKRIISLIRPENQASVRVAQRNNLTVEKNVSRFGYNHLVYVSESKKTP